MDASIRQRPPNYLTNYNGITSNCCSSVISLHKRCFMSQGVVGGIGFSVNIINVRAKKVVSDTPRLVDFAIGQVNSVFNLPDGQVVFFEKFE